MSCWPVRRFHLEKTSKRQPNARSKQTKRMRNTPPDPKAPKAKLLFHKTISATVSAAISRSCLGKSRKNSIICALGCARNTRPTARLKRSSSRKWRSTTGSTGGALALQEACFSPDEPLCEQEKQLALYLRYQTTHERA